MIRGIITVLGLCFLQGSYQINYQQALQLSRIGNVTELFERAMINRNGQRVGVLEVLPYFGTSGDQMYVGPGLELAMPDECSPRLTTVEVPRHDVDDVNVLLWPTCTRVSRCGGCCANNMLTCIPRDIRLRPITILKAKLFDSNEPVLMMDWEGSMQVEIEEHRSCQIVCRFTADDCNRRQQFDAFDCSCRCRRVRDCFPTQRWDLETCTCVCKDPNRQCPGGTVFNRRSCRCQINANQTYVGIEDGDGVFDDDTSAATTATPPTTTVAPTTTTTTTATPETADPCATQFCPPMFSKNLDDEGGCVCTPNFSFSGK